MFLRFLPQFVAVLLVAGCAASKPQRAPDPAEAMLAHAVSDIATSFQRMAAIEASRYQPDYVSRSYAYNNAQLPASWQRPVTLVEDYHGDVLQFVQMISAMSGMPAPRVLGDRPSRPIVVAISAGQRPLINFMADAGYQAGARATIEPVVELSQVLVKFN